MRVLLVSDVPMLRELGAGRVQLEAAEELRRRGHDVVMLDPRAVSKPLPRSHPLRPVPFAEHARKFLRRRSSEFDVVDALQACLPYSKEDLGFRGLLVVRSTGLHPLYREYLDYQRRQWPHLLPGNVVSQVLHRWRTRRFELAGWRSYEVSDVIRVLNEDERRFFSDHPSLVDRVVEIPEGLPDQFIEALASSREDSATRLERREVAVLGAWSLRKGAADWPQIVRMTTELVPGVRFRFLGTGAPAEHIHRQLGRVDAAEIVPRYRATELPDLLRTVAVGALPTYVEGYGLGVVEQLAAGIPSVAYDVPGPRTILRFDRSLLVPRGDAEAFAGKLAELLSMAPNEHAALSLRCLEVADQHRLSRLVPQLTSMYEERLGALGGA